MVGVTRTTAASIAEVLSLSRRIRPSWIQEEVRTWSTQFHGLLSDGLQTRSVALALSKVPSLILRRGSPGASHDLYAEAVSSYGIARSETTCAHRREQA